MSESIFNIIFIIAAITFNVLVIGIFIFQKNGFNRIVKIFGVSFISLLLPFSIIFISYILLGKDLWIIFFLIITIGLLIAQLLLDFILKIEFRKKLMTHIPYIILFYIVSFGLIGISFDIGDIYGYMVSISFWAVLVAVIYLYSGKSKKNKK